MLPSVRDPSCERLVKTMVRRIALRGNTCVGNVASCHEEVGPGLARWLGFGRRARPWFSDAKPKKFPGKYNPLGIFADSY